MSKADVAVIGGGAIGLAVARELARRGARVTILERGSPARESSWAAAGMLSPIGEPSDDPALLALFAHSFERWPAFAAGLREETGVELDYRTDGKLQIALDAAGAAQLREMERTGHAFGTRYVDAEAVRAEEPALAGVVAGLTVERDHRVNPRRLGQALWAAALAVGVELRMGVAATGIASAAGAVTGVRLATGDVVDAGAVVVAAGAWSGALEGLPAPLPVRPVRGEMLAVDAANADPPGLIRRVVFGPTCYLVPRPNQQVMIGATAEDVGFARGPTPAGIAALTAAAGRIAPGIERLPMVETWAGFRPGTPDGLPILGADPALNGLFHATGHHRNGILLTPVSAELVADAVLGGVPALDPTPFDVPRLRRRE